MTYKLFRPIDNAPLILFRIFFGFLFACETFGAIFTGWVRNNFVIPEFTFSHIGMEWLQPLPGYGMYFYFGIMGCLSFLVMIGYKYRFSLGMLGVLWAGAYFMQKTSYNNHYYLLLLVCILMFFLPANAYASVDAKQHPEIQQLSMPAWCSYVMIFQITIVYFYATVAKFYPDWLDGTYTRLLFTGITGYPSMHKVFTNSSFHIFIAYAGIFFDGLIVPLLLWKRTRTLAVLFSLVFHLFNSFFLKIGVFPYFALSYSVFFYPPETIRSFFFKQKPFFENQSYLTYGKTVLYWFFIPYFIVQLVLPLRHWFIKGDVLWTEEGHRLSWRMMLRQRNGVIRFKIMDKQTNEPLYYPVERHLTTTQLEALSNKPDIIWQMAQRIKEHYLLENKEVRVYVDCKVSINGRPMRLFINPATDLANADWNYFWHNDWILLSE
ncbi:hypothetical protein FCR2A7T_20460 [Flavobacterium cauense R2A-7]|uniref:Vitamin K-dependent gamma-carboxylase-like protein n=1 Tax=Flavobacterium cauense R2A-7 TaxID=1341154 RepID=V6RZI2_9FLAO|nr:HTTM domain-containing protein [Flavobacterium cauense]ESU19432.1 hypothetical protein FCR2A7T_20460 [Flavobacterium cauense R2A-7]KGO80392.1 HTTM domain-containing protein [Flavobacterium cauense R2A-7]TWI08308.1 vitamin K-dependent gamma-carboxylase-like protein [Flavobacterium cauense R2A-7]